MKTKIWFMLLLFVSCAGTLSSQDTAAVLDRVYGLDQTLCNGKKYLYAPPPGTRGHQYLLTSFYTPGSVTIKGKCYQDVMLNYDILNQQLLLQYANDVNPFNVIEVSKAWLSGFSLGRLNFELLIFGKDTCFYQVLGAGQVKILYFWRKILNLDLVIGSYVFNFTPAIKDSYILKDGKLRPFRNKRTLVAIFDPARRQEIKSYIRKHKIKVKKATDETMAELITFIGNLR